MDADQLSWAERSGWRGGNGNGSRADLVLFFGARQALDCGSRYHEMRAMFPHAHILGCSTGGQILNDDVSDDEIDVLAMRFDATRLRLGCEAAVAPESSRTCGEAIGKTLAAEDLAGIFVLSGGIRGRWRQIPGNTRRGRLRASQAEGRRHRILRALRAYRPRQRRRLG
jgi:hypothetical protein